MSPSRWRLRRVFRGPILTIAGPLSRAGVHPNTITYFTLLLALGAFLTIVLARTELFYGCLVFLVGFFDGVDGAVARISLNTSSYGALADSAVDKLAEVIVLLGIGIAFQTTTVFGLAVPLWVCVCISSWLFTSYLRSRAENLGVTDLDVGLGGRSERLFILSVLSVLGMALYGLVAVTALAVMTASYRFYLYGRQMQTNATRAA